jgi:ectoine hydroxylase-related dioxygenase (phytanoyl-CoA dioxygenase family)
MWNSIFDVGAENGILISHRILDILKPRLDALFESYYAPVATYMSKNSNPHSTCDLHRDFTTSDESLFQYRNIWIPLVPTTMRNGALYVLRRSHLVFDYVLPMFCEWPYKDMQDELFKHIETVECDAGDLVIYLDKTLHGSHVNRSEDSRPVVHFGALHPDVQLLYYHLDRATNKVRSYEVPFRFFFENDFSEPVGRYPLHGETEYKPLALTVNQVLQGLAV